jgi:hypothetical protein
MSGATAAPGGGTSTVVRSVVTKDEATADLVVAVGETLTQDNLTVPAGVSYTINGSARIRNLDVVSTGIFDVAAVKVDEVAE